MNDIFNYYREWFHKYYQENPVERPDEPDEAEEAHRELEGNIIDPKEEGIEIEQ